MSEDGNAFTVHIDGPPMDELAGSKTYLEEILLLLLAQLSYWVLAGAQASLLVKILWSKNCSGVSVKTQCIYSMVFAVRLLEYFINPSNISLSKVGLLLMTYGIILSVSIYNESYQEKHDNFRLQVLIMPSVVMGLLANYGPNMTQVFWAFSVYLEAIAIIPQICFCSKAKKVENSVYNYVLLLTLYKSFHVMGEMYNHFYASTQFDRISLAAGMVQLMLYYDFFTREVDKNKSEEAVSYVEAGSEQPSILVHCKEIEAGYTRFGDNLREVVLRPSMLTVVNNEKKVPSIADATAGAVVQEENKTTANQSPSA